MKIWASLIFILTGILVSYARFYVSQNKDLFSGLPRAERRASTKTEQNFLAGKNFASPKLTGLAGANTLLKESHETGFFEVYKELSGDGERRRGV